MADGRNVHCRPAGHILVYTLIGEWKGSNTWAYSDLPAVNILNLTGSSDVASGYEFHTTCLFCCFNCAVYRAVLLACNLE